jgi:dienelactone hydrolase
LVCLLAVAILTGCANTTKADENAAYLEAIQTVTDTVTDSESAITTTSTDSESAITTTSADAIVATAFTAAETAATNTQTNARPSVTDMTEQAAPAAPITRVSGEDISESEKQELIETAKGFLLDIVNGRFGECEEMFDDVMKKVLPEDKLIQAWSSIAVKAGGYETIVRADYLMQEGYDIIRIVSNHTSRDVVSTIVFSTDKRIAGLFFSDSEKSTAAGGDRIGGAGSREHALPDSVIEEEVSIGGDPRYMLKGKLTLPKDKRPGKAMPAIVLVHGSGPQDMDETIGANKPFRDIAWALAQNGIAVLRYDKRTYSYGGTMLDMHGTSLTVKEEVIDDAIFAKELLESDGRIDSGAIVVAGHSLGGMLAPRILDEGGFSGAIILAGSPRSLADIVLDQIDYTMSIGEYSDDDIMLQQSVNETQYEAYLSLGSETVEDIKNMLIFGLNGYYLWEMEQYKTANYFNRIEKPILILQGTKDFQVSYKNDFSEYQALAKGHANIELKAYYGLNHLFMKSTMENPYVNEYLIESTVDGQVIEDITKWVFDNVQYKARQRKPSPAHKIPDFTGAPDLPSRNWVAGVSPLW